jgi:hypothetical protein
VRNPLRSEAEAFRFLLVVIGGAVVIAVASWLNTWLGVVAAVVVIVLLVRWVRGGSGTEPR